MAWSGPAGSNSHLSLEPFNGSAESKVAVAPIKMALADPQSMPDDMPSGQTIIAKQPAVAAPDGQPSSGAASLSAPVTIPQHDIDESLQVEVIAPIPLPPIKRPVVERSHAEICDTLAYAAQTNDLPVPFFIRLLFQESGFQAHVVSHAGAEGIAQFMPATAAGMGLENPFDPLQAIPASARLLRELIEQFGNLGLAAAAYNAGPKRIQDWLAKKGNLPEETQGYVKTITGKPAETWTVASAGGAEMKVPRRAPCQQTAALYLLDQAADVPLPQPRAPMSDVKVAAATGKDAANATSSAAEKQATKTGGEKTKAAAADVAVKPAVTTTPDKRKQMIIRVADLKIAGKEPDKAATKSATGKNTENKAAVKSADAAAPAKHSTAKPSAVKPPADKPSAVKTSAVRTSDAKPSAVKPSDAKLDPSVQLAARQRKEAKAHMPMALK